MSAFIVDKITIDRVMTLMMVDSQIDSMTEAEDMGRQAWLMNVEAVRQRYPNDDPEQVETNRKTAREYQFKLILGDSLAQLHKALACLTYQCAEGNVPETYPLYKRLRDVEQQEHFQKLMKTKAWEEADWG